MVSKITIKARCPECGFVELPPQAFKVLVDVNDAAHAYIFRCSKCRQCTIKPIERRSISKLTDAGVETLDWRPPSQVSVRRYPPVSAAEILAPLVDAGAQTEAEFHAELSRFLDGTQDGP